MPEKGGVAWLDGGRPSAEERARLAGGGVWGVGGVAEQTGRRHTLGSSCRTCPAVDPYARALPLDAPPSTPLPRRPWVLPPRVLTRARRRCRAPAPLPPTPLPVLSLPRRRACQQRCRHRPLADAPLPQAGAQAEARRQHERRRPDLVCPISQARALPAGTASRRSLHRHPPLPHERFL